MRRRESEKKDDPNFRVRPYYSHYGAEYLVHLANELGRLRIGPDDLAPYQRDLFRELECWFNDPTSEGLETIYDYRRLDFGALARRRLSHEYQAPIYLPKPRISVSAEVTSKGNLSVRWHPWQLTINYDHVKLDEWAWHPGTTQSFQNRPEDEILFIRGVNYLRIFGEETKTVKAVTVTLIEVLASVFEGLIARLKHHFDIQLLTKFNIEDAKASSLGVKTTSHDGDPSIPAGWTLTETIDARREFLALFVEQFNATHGIDPASFLKECDPFRYEHGSINSDRASRHFRRAGLATMTPKTIDTLADTLHEATEARIWGEKRTVVPLRRETLEPN